MQGLQAQLEADLAALESELDRTRARANRMAAVSSQVHNYYLSPDSNKHQALAAVEAHEAGDDGGSPSDGETGGSEDSYVSGNGGNGRGAGA